MTTWIALFRGINVGGRNLLPMAQLVGDLESPGLECVRTNIQSGNAMFEAAATAPAPLAAKIGRTIEERHGFRPQLLLLTRDDLAAALAANPFPEAVSDAKSLHYAFLAEADTKADTAALDAAKAQTERWVLTERVFHLHAPDGIGRSKLATPLERVEASSTTQLGRLRGSSPVEAVITCPAWSTPWPFTTRPARRARWARAWRGSWAARPTPSPSRPSSTWCRSSAFRSWRSCTWAPMPG